MKWNMRWHPISTAPADGTPVDLWIVPSGISGTGPGRCPDCWHSNGKWWRCDEAFGDGDCKSEVANATHWMPLPSPPHTQSPDEEPQSGDEVSAADRIASLTQKIASLEASLALCERRAEDAESRNDFFRLILDLPSEDIDEIRKALAEKENK